MVSKLLQDGPNGSEMAQQRPGWVHGGPRNAHMSPQEAQLSLVPYGSLGLQGLYRQTLDPLPWGGHYW